MMPRLHFASLSLHSSCLLLLSAPRLLWALWISSPRLTTSTSRSFRSQGRMEDGGWKMEDGGWGLERVGEGRGMRWVGWGWVVREGEAGWEWEEDVDGGEGCRRGCRTPVPQQHHGAPSLMDWFIDWWIESPWLKLADYNRPTLLFPPSSPQWREGLPLPHPALVHRRLLCLGQGVVRHAGGAGVLLPEESPQPGGGAWGALRPAGTLTATPTLLPDWSMNKQQQQLWGDFVVLHAACRGHWVLMLCSHTYTDTQKHMLTYTPMQTYAHTAVLSDRLTFILSYTHKHTQSHTHSL